MRDEIRPRDTQTDGRVVDVVDEIMHIRRREIHEPVHLRHGIRARVAWEFGTGATEYDAEIRIEMRHQFVLIAVRGPSWDVAEESGRRSPVEEIDGCGLAGAVVAFVGPVEVWYQVYGRDCVARISVDSLRVQNSARLICAIWICGPEVWQRDEGACEG